MRKRSNTHTFAGNIEARKRQIEAELAKVPDASSRERLVQQIKALDAARHMEGWLRSSELRSPE